MLKDIFCFMTIMSTKNNIEENKKYMEINITIKEKIENEAKIPVTIPSYGEKYDVKEMPELLSTIKTHKPKTIKAEIVQRLSRLQSQIDDMKASVQEDLDNKDLKDEDMFRIKEKMKDLEQSILKIIEG